MLEKEIEINLFEKKKEEKPSLASYLIKKILKHFFVGIGYVISFYLILFFILFSIEKINRPSEQEKAQWRQDIQKLQLEENLIEQELIKKHNHFDDLLIEKIGQSKEDFLKFIKSESLIKTELQTNNTITFYFIKKKRYSATSYKYVVEFDKNKISSIYLFGNIPANMKKLSSKNIKFEVIKNNFDSLDSNYIKINK